MEKLQNNQQQALSDDYEFAVHLILDEQMSYENARLNLVACGMDEERAAEIISEICESINRISAEYEKEEEGSHIIAGFLWLIGGIVASAISSKLVFVGAIVYGIIKIFIGLSKKTR